MAELTGYDCIKRKMDMIYKINRISWVYVK